MISKKQLLSLYENGELYDLENSIQQDIEFWKSITNHKKVSSFLELCCGTGRIGTEILPFLEVYHGIDLSESFLKTFKQKIHKTNADFKLYNGDIKNFSTNRTYDIVAIPFNSMSHFYSLEDITKTFANVKRHMTENGKFVFDIHNPHLDFLIRDPNEKFIAKKFTDEITKKEITVYESNSYNKATQVNNIKWSYINEDNVEIKKLELPMRIFFPAEMDNYLKLNELKIINKYGSFDKKQFQSSSFKQIYICEKVK